MRITEPVCDVRLQNSDVHQFEQKIGASLPEDYKAFLLTYNGGRPEPSTFSFSTRQGHQEDCSVHYFFALHGGRVGSLERMAAFRGDRVARTDFLPIATDPFGNLVLIGLGNWNCGKIYFWDHELEDDSPSLKPISRVASSFTEFINTLSDLGDSDA